MITPESLYLCLIQRFYLGDLFLMGGWKIENGGLFFYKFDD